MKVLHTISEVVEAVAATVSVYRTDWQGGYIYFILENENDVRDFHHMDSDQLGKLADRVRILESDLFKIYDHGEWIRDPDDLDQEEFSLEEQDEDYEWFSLQREHFARLNYEEGRSDNPYPD